MPLVTLTTDFGTADGYVGAVKGVLAREAPGATVVDLAHDVPRHDVAHAAWVIATSAPEFPVGTVHVVVVDPGVGGARAEVVVRAGGHLFVGPDNGVFGHLGAIDGAWAIERHRRADASATFHGRDVFAPAAAALARGEPPESLGRAVALEGRLPWSGAVIVHVDRYGNLITNLRAHGGWVTLAGRRVPVKRTFEDVRPGELVAYVGSAGTVEIAVREGDASRALGLLRGEPVHAA